MQRMNLSTWETSHYNYLNAEEKDPIALLLPGDSALQGCSLSSAWLLRICAQRRIFKICFYVRAPLPAGILNTHTHTHTASWASPEWLLLWLEMPELWYTTFGGTNCIAASERMGDFLEDQDLVSDNPACTSEPIDSQVSVLLTAKSVRSQILYQTREGEGQMPTGFSCFKKGQGALHAWQDEGRFGSVPLAVSSFLRFCWLCCPFYMSQSDGCFSAPL